MNPENIAKVLAALEALVELPTAARVAEAKRRFAAEPAVLAEVLASLPFLNADAGDDDALRPIDFQMKIDLSGMELDHYRLVSTVGTGGVGIVYEARDLELDRTVAIKVLHPSFALSPTAQERFSREFRSAAALEHANIVRVYDSGEANGLQYCVMELIKGSDSLRDQKFAPRRAAEIMSQVCRGLEHSHATGVVHRDIKPTNVLLAPDGTPKIADFGLAFDERFAADSLTRTGELAGTLHYMSPEQVARRKQPITHLTDIYSAGAVLYELLVHRPPHDGQTSIQIFEAIRDEIPRRIGKSIPVDLATICYKALRKSPADRYQSAAEMADDLDRFLRGEPILARREPMVRRAKRFLSRPRSKLVIAGLALMICVAWGFDRAADAKRHSDWLYDSMEQNIELLLEKLPNDYNPTQDPRFPSTEEFERMTPEEQAQQHIKDKQIQDAARAQRAEQQEKDN